MLQFQYLYFNKNVFFLADYIPDLEYDGVVPDYIPDLEYDGVVPDQPEYVAEGEGEDEVDVHCHSSTVQGLADGENY